MIVKVRARAHADARRGRRAARLAALGAAALLALACGGGGSGGSRQPAPPTAGLQTYSVRWQQPAGASPDGYVLSLGTQPGNYDPSREIQFSASSARTRADGTLTYDIQLDRSRDQFLRLRAYNAGGSSPPSNELRVPALGAASAASTAASSASGASAGPSAASTTRVAAAPTSSAGVSSDGAASLAPTSGDSASAEELYADQPLRSVDLNGVDEFLATTSSAALDPGSGFTLSLWARSDVASVDRRGLLQLGCATQSCGIELVLDGTLEPALELWRTDAAGERTLARRVPIPSLADDWWHVAVALDAEASRVSLYVDGALAAAEAAPAELAGDDSAFRIVLGAVGDGAASWSGRLGHAALFDRALAAAEVEALALGGHELDLRAASSAPALAHYWRLGADSAAVGRDSSARPVPLDDAAGRVDAADIANDAPRARLAGDDPRAQ